MPAFERYLGWNLDIVTDQERSQQSWIGVTFALGALGGSVPSGMMADWIGRKWTLIGFSAIFTVGCVIQIATQNVAMLYAGRVIGGIGIGCMSCVTTMYNSEVSPKRVRGMIGTLFQLGITLGIVIAGLSNLGLKFWDHGWRLSYGGNCVFSIVLFIGMFFFPESPRYLVKKGKLEEARRAFTELRGDEREVEFEMWEVEQEVRQYPTEGTWCDTFSTKNGQLKRTFWGMVFFAFQQFSGINAIMFFAPVIIGDFFGDDAGLYGNIAIQTVNFLCTFIAVWAIDRYGRKILLLSGGIGQALSQLGVAILAAPYGTGRFKCHVFDNGEVKSGEIVSDKGLCLTSAPIEDVWAYQDSQGLGIAIILFCCIYVGFFSYSWGPLGWLICSEMQPMHCRAKAMTMSTLTHWGFSAIMAQVFPLMKERGALDLWGTFLLFACFCSCMTAWAQTLLPETFMVPLEELQEMWDDFKPGCNPDVYVPKAQRQEYSQASA